jgi:hypothetical protein
LAEQLTLNQFEPLANAEKLGTSLAGAAPRAAGSAEDVGRLDHAPSGEPWQVAAQAPGDNADLAEVMDRWATLPEAIRLAILSLLQTVK